MGRPPKHPSGAARKRGVRASPEAWSWWDELKQETGMSDPELMEYIRQACSAMRARRLDG
jgi:hypothetical protein